MYIVSMCKFCLYILSTNFFIYIKVNDLTDSHARSYQIPIIVMNMVKFVIALPSNQTLPALYENFNDVVPRYIYIYNIVSLSLTFNFGIDYVY